jgi:hypothetical protein
MNTQKCCDCGIELSFKDFCRINPSLGEAKAEDLWKLPIIEKYCPECFFNRPEKPFKKKRRVFRKF